MTDLSQAIAPKSDQLNADDLISGPRTIIITEVRGVSGDQPIAVYFEGDNGKPFKPCKSMLRIMVQVWGLDGNEYPGKSMTLYCDPKVKFGGIEVGGIRISHMSHIQKSITVPLTVTRTRRAPFTVKPLTNEPAIDNSAAINDARDAARFAAERGKDAFAAWWNSAKGKSVRHFVKPILPELQGVAEKADAQTDDDEDPFPGDENVNEG